MNKRALEDEIDEWVSYAGDLERDVEEFRAMLRKVLQDNDMLLKEIGYLHMRLKDTGE